MDPISSSKVSKPSKEAPRTSHRLSRSKMSAQIRGVGSLNLSLRLVQKATRNFSPSLKLGEGGFWTVYKTLLPDSLIVAVRRAKKVVSIFSYFLPMCPWLPIIGYSYHILVMHASFCWHATSGRTLLLTVIDLIIIIVKGKIVPNLLKGNFNQFVVFHSMTLNWKRLAQKVTS